MVWYGMVYIDLYSAIVAKVSNALYTLVPRKQPSFQALFERAKVLLCAEVVGRSSKPSGRAHVCYILGTASFMPVNLEMHLFCYVVVCFMR